MDGHSGGQHSQLGGEPLHMLLLLSQLEQRIWRRFRSPLHLGV